MNGTRAFVEKYAQGNVLQANMLQASCLAYIQIRYLM